MDVLQFYNALAGTIRNMGQGVERRVPINAGMDMKIVDQLIKYGRLKVVTIDRKGIDKKYQFITLPDVYCAEEDIQEKGDMNCQIFLQRYIGKSESELAKFPHFGGSLQKFKKWMYEHDAEYYNWADINRVSLDKFMSLKPLKKLPESWQQVLDGEADIPCPECKGSGEIITKVNMLGVVTEMSTTCSHCDGAGSTSSKNFDVLSLANKMCECGNGSAALKFRKGQDPDIPIAHEKCRSCDGIKKIIKPKTKA